MDGLTIDVITVLLSGILSFAIAFIIIPKLIEKMKESGITGKDVNKKGKPEIPEMGGIAVLMGFSISVFFLLSVNSNAQTCVLMASVIAIMSAAIVGMMDDIFDVRQRIKALMPFIFAIPLGILVDHSTMWFPFIGVVDFGILIILVIPFGVTCAANAANMLEGFNGLGAGLGIIITSTLIIISVHNGEINSLYLLIPLLGALSAFLLFNKYPAKIFPGDTLTLSMGATIACAAIIGNMKTIGAILFIPMIIEFFLKLRGHFEGECFGEVDENGYLSYNGKIESLTHVVMKWKRLKEWQLVALLWGIEGVLSAVVIILCIF